MSTRTCEVKKDSVGFIKSLLAPGTLQFKVWEPLHLLKFLN